MKATDDITFIKGVGSAAAQKFHKLRIYTVQDLVDYVPRRYDDYSKIIRVSQIRPGPVTLRVKIGGLTSRYSRKGLHMTEATGSDESGSVKLVWFNQPYRKQSIKLDEEYFVSGEFAQNYRFFAITNPACELVSSFPVNTARLIPQYRLTKGLGPALMRKVMKNVLTSYTPTETLPDWLLTQEDLMPKASALKEMHFPESVRALFEAKKRLGFEEIFELTLASQLNKEMYKNEHALQIPFNEQLTRTFVQSLPFKLTNDQRSVAWTIFQDMSSGSPMNRLVEGDVGSGKTVVAVLAAIGAMQSGFQVAFMAPTEILANQHAASLHELLISVGYHEKMLLLTGSMSAKQKQSAYDSIASGEAQLIVGTHALFQEKVIFHKLGLLIVDEQHRFGVEQRKKLQAKAYNPTKKSVVYEKYDSGYMPHVLNMTATPIPRSLALTLYGEMDVSIIAELPPGRKPVETEIYMPENREKVYREVVAEITNGRQAFVVCPQIEEDEAGRLSVIKIHDQLRKKWLKSYKLGLIHGKMKATEKDEVMQQFVAGELDVLVATTVIEVGVNIPNASVMVIEGADRFGLAQLHQLRGRVGRGADKSYCYLVLEENGEPSNRLKMLERENNGFKLAEYDLELRGPGAIYGTMQHGELDLRVAKLTDVELISQARQAAKQFIEIGESLLKYPQLKERVDKLRTITNLN
jgi:ATP-dependent DNA helicase RecG